MTYSAKRYRAYAKDSEAVKRYRQSDKAKACRDRYRKSAKGIASARKARDTKKRIFREIVEAAKAVPCADCGGVFPSCCMDFHHIRDKSFTIGWGKHTPTKLRQEIAKCVVICSNCHRIRHARKSGAS